MSERKIVGIATALTRGKQALVALADDGTLWEYVETNTVRNGQPAIKTDWLPFARALPPRLEKDK